MYTHPMVRVLWAVILCGSLVTGSACRQAPPTPEPAPSPPAPSREAIVAAAKGLIARVPFATLTTIGEDGSPQSRIVDPFPLEDDFTVWMATNGASRKVAQIERDPRATVLYFDQAAPGYVSLLGTAAIVRDPSEKAKRWKESWVGFYTDRNRGDDYTLIRFTPDVIEISSATEKMSNDPRTWRPVTLSLR